MRSDTCSPVEVRALTAGGRRPFAYLPQAPPRGEAPPHAHCTTPYENALFHKLHFP